MDEKFEIIYKDNYNSLRNAVENIISDKDASHDVVQEIFLKLWKKKNELDFILDPKAYLFKAAINASISYLETHKNRVRLSDIRMESSENTDSLLKLKELEVKIQIALDNLPPKCKAIFVLSRYEEMKYTQIAEYLNLSVKTVENQMGIAIKRMREELKAYLPQTFLRF
ncbi:MAG: RNA polymerase sigma-70 factor [Bacteroidia bacterium]